MKYGETELECSKHWEASDFFCNYFCGPSTSVQLFPIP